MEGSCGFRAHMVGHCDDPPFRCQLSSIGNTRGYMCPRHLGFLLMSLQQGLVWVFS